MRYRYLLLLCMLLPAIWPTGAWAAAETGKLMLRGESDVQRPVALDGEWHFFPNQLVGPEQLHARRSSAIDAQVPGGWGSKALSAQPRQGVGTYWLELVVGNALPQPLALHFERFCGASTIYFFADTKRSAKPLLELGHLGTARQDEILAGGDTLIDLPPLKAGVYHLLVQQTNFHLMIGGLCGRVAIGEATVVTHRQAQKTIKSTVIVTLLLSLALGSLLLGSQNGERAAPWLALLCTSAAVLIVGNTGLLDALMPPHSVMLQPLRHGLYALAILCVPSSLLMIIRHTFALTLPRMLITSNMALALLLILGVAVLLLLPAARQHISALYWLIQGAWAAQLIVAGIVLAIACRRRRQYARLVLGATLPLLLTMSIDFYRFHALGLIDMLSVYAITFLAVVYCGIYTLKFGSAYRLAARLSLHLQEEVELRTAELRDKNYKLEQTQIALQRANETLKHLSITDSLTRVHNRMYFEQQFEKEWRRCGRNGLPLSVLMIDADHFKELNDSAGHLVGDFCLQALAREIERHFKRSGELVARYGGEEFIVLLPDSNQSKSLTVAENLRTAIEHMPIYYNADPNDADRQFRVTVSIGIATTVPSIDQPPSQLVATADAALYQAKDAGRNRVHCIPLTGLRSSTGQPQPHL